MPGYCINGRFLARKMVGQERFAYETILELDKLVSSGFVELIVPSYVKKLPELKNIRIVHYGNLPSEMWEQINFTWYVITHYRTALNFCNLVPLLKPGIVCIHDVFYKTQSCCFHGLRGKISMCWHRLHYLWSALFAKCIFTVSEYSKKEIMKHYHVSPERIVVVYNGWQHMNRIAEDNSVFSDFPEIVPGKFFLVLGSLNEYKNLRWIIESARKCPNATYVISGKIMLSAFCQKKYDFSKMKNIILTGFLTDGKIKSLMRSCKALIFPSKAEGFGIPPLETLSQGRPIIISNTTCLPEIYGEYAHYLCPYDYQNVNPDVLMENDVKPAKELLQKYSWANTALKILEMLKL